MSQSATTTTCSTPTNDTVEKVIKNDTVRYVRKGYGLISASMLTTFYFFVFPSIIKEFWPILKTKSEENQFYLIAFPSTHTGTFIITNIVMWFIYTKKIPFFERYRIDPERKWPWEEGKEEWSKFFKKTMKYLLLNHFAVSPLLLIFEIFVLGGPKCRYDISSFPNSFEIIRQIIFFMFCEDFFFYWGHRALHNKKIYPYIHKIHHEYINPISLSSEYAHPVEFLFGNVLPTVSGILILGNKAHFATCLMWFFMRVLETVDGHCGYEFSWSPYRLLPLSGSSNFHNFHHTHNVGNYGSFFTLWDAVFGTSKEYYKYLSKKEKKEILLEKRKPVTNNEVVQKLNEISKEEDKKNK